uniref:PHD finger protein 14 n=1 Tax=Schistosoma haematobium TaxID=6185 RepID=A0A094ZYU3_SCHHA
MTSDTLFTAIARRDPSKRQIKPVNTEHLALLDELDDDSDSEYVCEERDEDDDEETHSGCTDEEGSSPDDSSVSSSNVSEASGTSRVAVSKYGRNSPNAVENGKYTRAPESFCTGPDGDQDLTANVNAKIKDVDIMICMLCLGDNTDPRDELIECDGCGIVVHEDCYKLVDSIFLSSGASSSSTDAWFCEPCLAGITSPVCELCPVLDGVFKKTDNNRWVHLLCALYTPGVAFNDPDNLMDLVYLHLAHSAQKHGLLSEPTVEESSADPFFAHCRQHTDKTVARHRRRNFLTTMLRLKKWRSNRQLDLHCLDEKKPNISCLRTTTTVDPRIQRKLEHYHKLYKDVLRNREKPYVPLVKTPMFLETSPVAMRMFVLKAKALNLPIELSNHMSNADSSKGPTPSYPVFTPDFVSYFLGEFFMPEIFERERKITEVSKLIATLQNTQRELQISDASASHSYNSVSTELEKLNSSRGNLRVKFIHIVNSLRSLIPELKCSSELETILAEPRRLPETASFDVSSLSNPVDSNKTAKFGSSAVIAASKRRGNRSSPCKLRKASKSEAVDQNVKPLDIPAASHLEKCSSIVTCESENVILECMMCHGLQDQHLITSCDTCGKAFHLACLDPPLLRMPKRSKLYGWQCSFCTKEVSSIPGAEAIDVNAPRQLRRSSGIPSDRTTCVKTVDLKPDIDPISQVSAHPIISGEIKSSPTREPVSKTLRRSVSSAPTYQGNLGNPVKNGKRTSSTILKTISGLSSKRISMSTSKQTKRCVSSQLPLEKDVKINIGCKFKFTDETEDEPMIHAGSSLKSKCESDEEIAQLRSSKVIKFVQIRDHESNGESEAVERIAPLQQRYVICQEANPHPKRSTAGKFRLKFKKL